MFACGWRTGGRNRAGEVSLRMLEFHRTLPRHGPPPQSSKPGTCRSMHSGLPRNLCGKQVGFGGGNRLSSAVETSCSCMADQTCCLADYQIQYWKRMDALLSGGSLGKPYNGSICKFGEQVHYKLSGHPSSRVEPRWELGAWLARLN